MPDERSDHGRYTMIVPRRDPVSGPALACQVETIASAATIAHDAFLIFIFAGSVVSPSLTDIQYLKLQISQNKRERASRSHFIFVVHLTPSTWHMHNTDNNF